MNAIELAREIGKEIQKDPKYLALVDAKAKNDADTELQEGIGKFNVLRININNEASQDTPDEAKIEKINNEMKDLYEKVMGNESMIAYNDAKAEIDELVNKVNQVITMSLNGSDPDSIDVDNISCEGDCSGCSTCG